MSSLLLLLAGTAALAPSRVASVGRRPFGAGLARWASATPPAGMGGLGGGGGGGGGGSGCGGSSASGTPYGKELAVAKAAVARASGVAAALQGRSLVCHDHSRFIISGGHGLQLPTLSISCL